LCPYDLSGSFDVNLDPMTLIWYEFDPDILEMLPTCQNGVSRSMLSKIRARTGQTDAQAVAQTYRQTDTTERITSCIRFAGSENTVNKQASK